MATRFYAFSATADNPQARSDRCNDIDEGMGNEGDRWPIARRKATDRNEVLNVFRYGG